MRTLLACLLASTLPTLAACADEIGDDCETALDCSQQGSRICDRTQPGGYCTLRGCERATCPEEAVCVKFRPAEERLAVTYCMYACEEHDDCRDDEGYSCTSAQEIGDGTEAEVLDGASKRFCSAAPREPIPLPDAASGPVDAPMSEAGTSDDDASSEPGDASSSEAGGGDASPSGGG